MACWPPSMITGTRFWPCRPRMFTSSAPPLRTSPVCTPTAPASTSPIDWPRKRSSCWWSRCTREPLSRYTASASAKPHGEAPSLAWPATRRVPIWRTPASVAGAACSTTPLASRWNDRPVPASSCASAASVLSEACTPLLWRPRVRRASVAMDRPDCWPNVVKAWSSGPAGICQRTAAAASCAWAAAGNRHGVARARHSAMASGRGEGQGRFMGAATSAMGSLVVPAERAEREPRFQRGRTTVHHGQRCSMRIGRARASSFRACRLSRRGNTAVTFNADSAGSQPR